MEFALCQVLDAAPINEGATNWMRGEASIPRLRSSPRGQPRPRALYQTHNVTKHDTGLTTSRPSVTGGR
jgi:hypothetical protein